MLPGIDSEAGTPHLNTLATSSPPPPPVSSPNSPSVGTGNSHSLAAPSLIPPFPNPPSSALALTVPLPATVRGNLAIDAQMYPHLIDTIFGHADARALLYLRTASRAWRTRANTALTVHLAFRDDKAYAVGPQGDVVPHPAFERSLLTKHKAKPRKYRLGTPRDWTKAMVNIHTVDWIDEPEGFFLPSGFRKKPIPILRLWEDQAERPDYHTIAPAAHTVVVFPPQPAPGTDMAVTPVLYTPFFEVAPDTSKVVLNVSTASSSHDWCCSPVFSTIEWYEAVASGSLQEIVINMTVPSHSGIGGSSTRDPFHASTLGHLLLDGIVGARRTNVVKFTWVNSDALPARLLRAIDVEWCEDVQPKAYAAFKTAASFQECAEAYLQEEFELGLDGHSEGDSDFKDEWNKDGRVQFLTSVEYEAKVGTAKYRLETLERPWEL